MELIRKIFVSHDALKNNYKVDFECAEENGNGIQSISEGTLMLVSKLEDKLVAINSRTKKQMFVWGSEDQMVEELTMEYECAVTLCN